MISIMSWWTSEQVCIEHAVPVALLPGTAIRGMLFLLRALLEGNVARNPRTPVVPGSFWRQACGLSPLFFQPSLGAVSQRFGGDSRENLATKPDCVVKPLRNPSTSPRRRASPFKDPLQRLRAGLNVPYSRSVWCSQRHRERCESRQHHQFGRWLTEVHSPRLV